MQCPATTVTLVKTILLWNTGPDPCVVYPAYNRSTTGVGIGLTPINLAAGTHAYSEIWIVLEPNDTLTFYVTGNELKYWVSGALLPQPP